MRNGNEQENYTVMFVSLKIIYQGGIEMKDKNLCNAVDCIAISAHTLKCVIELEGGKEEIHTIKFCHDHYLRQKALEYNMEEHVRDD